MECVQGSSKDNCQNNVHKVLLVEAFYGGSHKQLLDALITSICLLYLLQKITKNILYIV